CNLPRYKAQSRRFDSRRWQTRYPPRTFALHSGLKRKLSGKASLSQEEAKTTLFPGYPRRVKIVTGSHAKDPAFAHSTVPVYNYRNEKTSFHSCCPCAQFALPGGSRSGLRRSDTEMAERRRS